MRRTMVDEILHAFRNLVFQYFIGDARASGAFFLQFHLHIATALANFPEFLHVGIKISGLVRDDERAVIFAAMTANVRIAFYLQRHVALNAVEQGLIRMWVSTER